jgi:succinate-semialdehyde dehydrogenase / glutarate-semialdehyde dehydrogenase
VAAKILSANKYRNAGQICVAPTRFIVHQELYKPFVDRFVAAAKAVTVGNGMTAGVTMGPLATARRVEAMEGFIADAVAEGAKVRTGGRRIGNTGYFFEPTVLTDVPPDARVMNEELFGPIAIMLPFRTFDEAISEANRLPYGLAAYAYTRSLKTAAAVAAAFESGTVSINHHGLAPIETPLGGVKDSGYGSEGRRGDRSLSGDQVRDADGVVTGGGASAKPPEPRSARPPLGMIAAPLPTPNQIDNHGQRNREDRAEPVR